MSDLSLLPHDPERFFGLETDYDRRDLKRSYGKAIREFKPETHPKEFQLIREGYERLEQQLRYGKRQATQVTVQQTWTAATQNSEASSVSIRELAAQNPKAALKRLTDQPSRTPPEYYMSAVLTDVVAGKLTAHYLAQLVDGLSKHPSDPGLMMLVSEYVRHKVPDRALEKTLHYLSDKLPPHLFYRITEPLWGRLVDQLPFEQFAGLLKCYDEKFTQGEPSARSTFYLGLLRSAIWKAPPSWSASLLDELDSQSAYLTDHAQNELEFLQEIRLLLSSELPADKNNPVRARLREVIQLSCSIDQGTASGKMIRILSEICQDSASFQSAFPVEVEENTKRWVRLIYRLVEELRPLVIETETNVFNDTTASQTKRLLKDLQMDAEAVFTGTNRAQYRYHTVPSIASWVICMIGIIIVGVIATETFTQEAATAFSLIATVGFGLGLRWFLFNKWLFPQFLAGRMADAYRRWSMLEYKKLWRTRLFRHAQASNEPLNTLIERIHGYCSTTDREELAQGIEFYVQRDPGLCIYSDIKTLMP